jgi:outer membrane protein
MRRLALVLALAAALAPAAHAAGLLDTWRAAAAHDPEFAAARAGLAAGEARTRQAGALWRPSVSLQAGAGLADSESAMHGARFSAPGFGQSTGVDFATSINGGTSTRYALSLRQPLFDAERSAQAGQLKIAGEIAQREWEAARQSLMLRSAQRYLEASLAAQQLRLVEQQLHSAEQARTEAEDRFRIGDRPITEVHEATARAAALRAQRVALLADLIGAAPPQALALPGPREPALPEPLDAWLARATAGNPQVLLAEAQVRYAGQEAQKTAAAVSPIVDLVAQAGRERLSGSGDFGSASNTSMQRAIGVQLTLPLYTGGMRSSRHDEAAALAEKARAELARAREQATQQARGAWLDLSVARSRTAALASALQAARARLDATQVGLQAGDRTTLDLLNAQNDAASAELALLHARAQFQLQRLQLAATAGVLDEAVLAAVDGELVP